MLEKFLEIKANVANIANLVIGKFNMPLQDKVVAKELSEKTVLLLDEVSGIKTGPGDQKTDTGLTVAELSRKLTIAVSSVRMAKTLLKESIVTNDVEVTGIEFTGELIGRRVTNSFTNMNGVVVFIFSTKSNKYGLVLGDDNHHHVALIKYWLKEN